jgi:hypothetical protein
VRAGVRSVWTFGRAGRQEKLVVLRRVTPHLTYANVVSTLCLFIVLGGTSYAAVKLAKNSVGSKQIARNAVKASETARNSVGSAEVIDRSLLAKDFKPGQLPAAGPGATGPAGATGSAGAAGPAGPPGPPGPTRGATSAGLEAVPPLAFVAVVPNTSHPIDMPSTGRLFAIGTGTFKAVCGPDPCTVELRLWVIPQGGTGESIHGTLRVLSAAATQSVEKTLTMLGVSDSLPAGTHTIFIGRQITQGTGVTFTASGQQTASLALGG